MIQRCSNHKRRDYKNYGAVGITVCDRWLGENGFENFLADLGERPANKTLDRINPFGNYEPGNCRWATRSEQNRNKKANWLKEHPELAKAMEESKVKRVANKKESDLELLSRGVIPYPARWKRMSELQRYVWLGVNRTSEEERARCILESALKRRLNELDRALTEGAQYQRAKSERKIAKNKAKKRQQASLPLAA